MGGVSGMAVQIFISYSALTRTCQHHLQRISVTRILIVTSVYTTHGVQDIQTSEHCTARRQFGECSIENLVSASGADCVHESMDAPMVKQDGEDTRGEKYRIKRRGSLSQPSQGFLVDESAIQQARAEFAKMHANRKSEIQMTRISLPHNASSILSGKPQKQCSPSLIEKRMSPYDVTPRKERSSSMDDTHAGEVDNATAAKCYSEKKGLTRQLTANAKLESVRKKSVNFFSGAIKAFKRENRALSFTSPLPLPSKYPPWIISCTDPRRIGWDIQIVFQPQSAWAYGWCLCPPPGIRISRCPKSCRTRS